MAKADNSMSPIDVGAAVLIPKGNLDLTQAGSYAGMRKALDDAWTSKSTIVSRASTNPDFKPGLSCIGNIDWQCSTNVTSPKR